MPFNFKTKLKEENKNKDSSFNTENKSKRYYQLDDRVEPCIFKKEGTYYFNVIPFRTKKGEWDYMLTTFMYSRLGPNNDDFLALSEYGLPDPVKEEKQRIEDESDDGRADWDSIKAFVPKKHAMLLLQPLDDRGLQIKGAKLKVWEGFYGSTKVKGVPYMLTTEANKCLMGADVIDYANPDIKEGRIVAFTVKKDSFKGREFMSVDSISFIDRKEAVDEKMVMSHGIMLEDYLITPTYKELEDALFGVAPSDTETQSRADDMQPREETETDEQVAESERTLKDADGNSYQDPFPDQPTEQEEVEDRERELEDERDEREDEPQTCPMGHPWGECMKHKPDCNKCSKADWQKCKALRK